jgi:hypothetical protein
MESCLQREVGELGELSRRQKLSRVLASNDILEFFLARLMIWPASLLSAASAIVRLSISYQETAFRGGRTLLYALVLRARTDLSSRLNAAVIAYLIGSVLG